jgi:glycosyltransferase involved in cell wall biosynthesis
MGKAAIYNPYLNTLGGGERYSLSFAKALADNGWVVDVEWKDNSIKEKLEQRLGMDLSKVNFVSDVKKGSGYDLCFWVSDGSIPLLHSRKNFLHFQVPFHDVDGRSLFNRMKLFRINKIICNSKFTKNVIDQEFGVDSIVLYPPIDVSKIKPRRKENIILYVGRFSKLVQSKRQDILITAFKKFSKKVSGWKLILAGGSDVGGREFVQELREKSKGYDIEILEGVDFKILVELYGKARFFWSASGFGVNEKKNPEQVEHFGITIVEAMAGGAVPLVYNAGGGKEIINNGKDGFLWNSVNQLVKKTEELINNSGSCREVSRNAVEKSKLFGNEKFNKEILALL